MNFAFSTISCNFFTGCKLLKALSFSPVMQLEKELRELTLQRDLAQSQVEELRDDRLPMIWVYVVILLNHLWLCFLNAKFYSFLFCRQI